jgi:hypothetical protein
MTHDEAWRAMGFTDGAQFSRAIAGERPLDARKVDNAPWELFLAFVTLWIAEKARDFGTEFRGDRLRMAKAELPAERKDGAA